MAANDPAERQEITELGNHVKWSQVTDRTAATAPARRAFRAAFEAQIPPEVTDPAQRASMVDHAIGAWLVAKRREKRKGRLRPPPPDPYLAWPLELRHDILYCRKPDCDCEDMEKWIAHHPHELTVGELLVALRAHHERMKAG
jgi:hypothetical protein